jgi:hypothetical protein
MLANPFWFRKITPEAYIFALANIMFSDDRYRKLKIYISELVLYTRRYEYILLSNIAMNGVIKH